MIRKQTADDAEVNLLSAFRVAGVEVEPSPQFVKFWGLAVARPRPAN